MTARPAGAAWQPLGLDGDPVPGDPDRVDAEASHLSQVARQIADQVGMLKKIASQGTEVGQHADKIRTTASSLAGKLDTVGARYRTVSSALSGWAPELRQAQSMSVQALNEAEGPYKQLTTPAVLPSGSKLTAAQKQAVTDHNNAMTRAQGQLDAAQALLGRATSLRDSQGSHYAGVISRACDDGLKDSFWDRFKDFVGRWKWLIGDICTGLEITATVLALIGLAASGIGLAVILGLGVAALAGRVLLASTGNGSWVEVAEDAFSVVTAGAGSAVEKGLEEGFEGVVDAATAARAGQIADSPAGQVAAKVAGFATGLKESPLLQGATAAIRKLGMPEVADNLAGAADKLGEFVSGQTESAISHLAESSVTKTLEGVSTKTGPLEALRQSLDSGALVQARKVAALAGKFGGDADFDAAAARFSTALNVSRVHHALETIETVKSVKEVAEGFELDGPDGNPVVSILPAQSAWHLVKSLW